MFRKLICLGLSVCSLSLTATERLPWFGNDLEWEARGAFAVQWYDRVDVNGQKIHHSSFDTLQKLSIALSPEPEWSGELEAVFASSDSRSWGADSLKAMGRYLFMDDIIGDLISLSSGLSITLPTGDAKRDLGRRHHSSLELEGHLALGKEISSGRYWNARFFNIFALAQGVCGYPRLNIEGGLEFNHKDQHQIGLKGEWLCGLGSHDLPMQLEDFRGYHKIDHHSFDLVCYYQYWWEYTGYWTAEWVCRLDAKNAPKDLNRLQISFLYPFGI
ncbi:MAG: hypothetical protein CMO81_08555 [Waddliaceae bacterium]|nr:hypothetical protein [Waddliaceae bacterium]